MKKFIQLSVITILLAGGALAVKAGTTTAAAATVTIYRDYNKKTSEHFYTANHAEWQTLPHESANWTAEKASFSEPTTGTAIYRVYNPKSGEHFFTASAFEKNALVKKGWRSEGVAFHSGGSIPVYRLYNPHAKASSHFNTASIYEKNQLISKGWRNEGVAWKALSSSEVAASDTQTTTPQQAAPQVAVVAPAPQTVTLGSGTFTVGTDIPAGKYFLSAGENSQAEIDLSFSGTQVNYTYGTADDAWSDGALLPSGDDLVPGDMWVQLSDGNQITISPESSGDTTVFTPTN